MAIVHRVTLTPSKMELLEQWMPNQQWNYDAAGDPVYASALAAAILTGQPQADQCFEVDGRTEIIPESVHLQSTGKSNNRVPVIGSAVPDTIPHRDMID